MSLPQKNFSSLHFMAHELLNGECDVDVRVKGEFEDDQRQTEDDTDDEAVPKLEQPEEDIDSLFSALTAIRERHPACVGGRSVYFITDGRSTKIGIAAETKPRLYNIQTCNAEIVSLHHKYECLDAKQCESELHAAFQRVHKHGEWYKLSQLHMHLIQHIFKPRRLEVPVPDPGPVLTSHNTSRRKRKFAIQQLVSSFPEIATYDLVHKFLTDTAYASNLNDPQDYVRVNLAPLKNTRAANRPLRRKAYPRLKPEVEKAEVVSAYERVRDVLGPQLTREQLEFLESNMTQIRRIAQYYYLYDHGLLQDHESMTEVDLARFNVGLHCVLSDISSELGLPGPLPIIESSESLYGTRVEDTVLTDNEDELLALCRKSRRARDGRRAAFIDVVRATAAQYKEAYGVDFFKVKSKKKTYHRLHLDPRLQDLFGHRRVIHELVLGLSS
jgi:hypothetical protein